MITISPDEWLDHSFNFDKSFDFISAGGSLIRFVTVTNDATHHSLDETNPMTYIIFLETYRARLNAAQVKWLDNKIDNLTEQQRQTVENGMENIDVELATKPITEKMEDTGLLRQV